MASNLMLCKVNKKWHRNPFLFPIIMTVNQHSQCERNMTGFDFLSIKLGGDVDRKYEISIFGGIILVYEG